MSNSVIWLEILFDIEKFNNFSNGQLKDDIFFDDPKSEMNFHQLVICKPLNQIYDKKMAKLTINVLYFLKFSFEIHSFELVSQNKTNNSLTCKDDIQCKI